MVYFFFFSSRRRHTRFDCDWSSDVCSSDLNLYPYVYYSTIDGFWGAVHYGRYSPVGAVERPEDNLASLSFDGGASTQGSYVILADARAPAWWEGWRVGLRVTAARANRLGYYGIGNDAAYSRDSLTAAGGGPYFYPGRRKHGAARATPDRESTPLDSRHQQNSYCVLCL